MFKDMLKNIIDDVTYRDNTHGWDTWDTSYMVKALLAIACAIIIAGGKDE